MSDGLELTAADPDSDGCLCVVASFAGPAGTIGEVTAEAAKRARMSPVLGDFIEFRFTGLEEPSGPTGDRSTALQRITDALLNPQTIAGRNYFAVVVVDRSAAKVEQVLSDCAASPFLADLRPRFLGISNVDDRQGRGLEAEPSSFPDIVTSPTGIWSRKEDLVDILRGFVDELQRHFSARHEPGLSGTELGELKARYHQRTRLRDPGPERDMLADDPGPAPAAIPQAPDLLAQHPRSHSAERATDGSTGVDGSAAGGEEPTSEARRWFPGLRKRRHQQPEADGAEDGQPASSESEVGAPGVGPTIEGLVYLLIIGDESSGDEAALNRSRSALLDIDKKIAGLPQFAYQVRMLSGGEDGLRGDVREAGQLGRRDVKRTVASGDFAAVLESVRSCLQRDRLPSRGADAAVRPVVVFLTPEPPLADTVAAELFRELAREVPIVWALPKSAQPLLSGAFVDAPGVQVIADGPAVADEVAALLELTAVLPGTA